MPLTQQAHSHIETATVTVAVTVTVRNTTKQSLTQTPKTFETQTRITMSYMNFTNEAEEGPDPSTKSISAPVPSIPPPSYTEASLKSPVSNSTFSARRQDSLQVPTAHGGSRLKAKCILA